MTIQVQLVQARRPRWYSVRMMMSECGSASQFCFNASVFACVAILHAWQHSFRSRILNASIWQFLHLSTPNNSEKHKAWTGTMWGSCVRVWPHWQRV